MCASSTQPQLPCSETVSRVDMQKRISTYFGSSSSAKRVKLSSDTVSGVTGGEQDSSKCAEADPYSLPPPAPVNPPEGDVGDDVAARIAANRAAAKAKLAARAGMVASDKRFDGAVLEPSWRTALSVTVNEPFWKQLSEFVARERTSKVVYPPRELLFSAFNNSPYNRTKVVIIGQDPYHGPRQAHGMCFSVMRGVAIPPSLKNIYTELESDIRGWKAPKHGNLEAWAKQGVLLLNSVLTVEGGKANSHRGRGWERFTDAVVAALNKRDGKGCVFMLWGGPAKQKGSKINQSKHCVLRAVHPSPLSAHNGWFGSKHFSQANEYLIRTKQAPIDWTLPL